MYGCKKRKTLSMAVNCMLSAAVVAGGLFGNADIVSAKESDPTAKIIGGDYIDTTSGYYLQKDDATSLIIEAPDYAGTDYIDYSSGDIFGRRSTRGGDVTGGNIIMNGGEVSDAIYGGMSREPGKKEPTSGKAYNNRVTINNGTIHGGVVGGFTSCSIEENSADNNTVEIFAGSFSGGTGGIIGGCSSYGNATGNKVIIHGGMFGDESNTCVVYGGVANKNAAVGNEVIISGGTFFGDVYGGCGPKAAYNIVNIIGTGGEYSDGVTIIRNTGNINIKSCLGGGYVSSAGESKNNTINVYGSGTLVNSLAAGAGLNNTIQNLNFYIQDGLKYGDTMLKVNEPVSLENIEKIGIKIQGTPAGNKNDGITLLAGAAITGYDAKKVEIDKGTLTFEGAAELKDDAKLVLNIKQLGKVNENGKSLVETRAAAAAVVNNMTDFTLEQGMAQARAAVAAEKAEGGNEFAPFVAFGGSKFRYETGSHVDMKGWNASIGVSKGAKDAVYGIAVEYGTGNYDSYLDNGHHASGDAKSTGAVIFAELNKKDGSHFDATVRAGRVETDYKNDANINYDDDANYFGFSIGGGKEFAAGKNAKIDVYGRFYYNHTAGSDVTSSDGNHNHFGAVNSKRIRIGTRYTYNVNEKNKLYAGLAWQHEFDGDARATINGYGAPTPSLNGSSGMMELGWNVEACKNMNIDLNMNGWVGKQRGVSGGVSFRWAF